MCYWLHFIWFVSSRQNSLSAVAAIGISWRQLSLSAFTQGAQDDIIEIASKLPVLAA